jgi:hypothetical protein
MLLTPKLKRQPLMTGCCRRAEPSLRWPWSRLPPAPPSGLDLVEPTSVTSDFSSRYIGFLTFVSPRAHQNSFWTKTISQCLHCIMAIRTTRRRVGTNTVLKQCTIFLLSVETAVEASIIHAKR